MITIDEFLANHPKMPLTSAVYNVLLQEITSLRLKPGENLPISLLAEELGVSMTPVREALARLGENGLVIISKSKKAHVADFDLQDYNHLLYFRMTMETLAAKDACQDRQQEAILELCRQCDALDQLYDRYEQDFALLSDLINADAEFHFQIVKCSGNPLLIQEYENILPQSKFYRQFFIPNSVHPCTYPQIHRNIVNAICNADADYAAASVRLHYRASSDLQIFSEL